MQNSNNHTHPDLNIQLQQNHQQNYQQNNLQNHQNHQQNHQQKQQQSQQQQTVVLPASDEKMVPQLQQELQGSSTSIARTPTKTQFVFELFFRIFEHKLTYRGSFFNKNNHFYQPNSLVINVRKTSIAPLKKTFGESFKFCYSKALILF